MNYAKQQKKLFDRMGVQSLKVMASVNAPNPSESALWKRHAAAQKLEDLANELAWSIEEQIADRFGPK